MGMSNSHLSATHSVSDSNFAMHSGKALDDSLLVCVPDTHVTDQTELQDPLGSV